MSIVIYLTETNIHGIDFFKVSGCNQFILATFKKKKKKLLTYFVFLNVAKNNCLLPLILKHFTYNCQFVYCYSLFTSYFYFFFFYLCFCSVSVILLHCGSFCHKNKFLVCVNIPGNKAYSDSEYEVNSASNVFSASNAFLCSLYLIIYFYMSSFCSLTNTSATF